MISVFNLYVFYIFVGDRIACKQWGIKILKSGFNCKRTIYISIQGLSLAIFFELMKITEYSICLSISLFAVLKESFP